MEFEISRLMFKGEVWFLGNPIAKGFGYKDLNKAIAKKVLRKSQIVYEVYEEIQAHPNGEHDSSIHLMTKFINK